MLLASASLLIIEDQPDICDLIELSLLGTVNNIHKANSIAEASILQSTYKFDVAIVDTCLPDGDPYPIVQKLIMHNCKVLLTSGNFEMNQRLTHLSFARIEKPFRISQLIQSVETTFSTATPNELIHKITQ